MANIAITSDAWTEISITSGTVQNISATADIELSAEQTDNSGVVLKPSEIYQWDNETIYARAVTENTGALRVVNFKRAAGGGGSYVLPVATASKLGGVKIGGGLSIDASGVLSAPVTYSTTEQVIGTWIDGKPLYQKTYINPVFPLSVGAINLKNIQGYGIVANISGVPIPYVDIYNSYGVYFDLPTNKLNLNVSGQSINVEYITIKYTKTTD